MKDVRDFCNKLHNLVFYEKILAYSAKIALLIPRGPPHPLSRGYGGEKQEAVPG
jgi:hypothetical protein